MARWPGGMLSGQARGQRVAWLFLIVCLGLSVWVWHQARERVWQDAGRRFELRVSEVSRAIQVRMKAYEQVLRGGVGLFYASGDVERHDWRAYVEHLQLEKDFPGIQGMGYTVYLQPGEVPALEQRVRAEGFPDFRVWPEGEREIYTSILYLEPFGWRNQRAFGFDMYSQPARRAAMMQARDRGVAAVTDKVILVQETSQATQAGFLMYLPVYEGSGVPATIEARREKLAGFVYSPFRMADLMHGALGPDIPGMLLRIYDGGELTPSRLMYSSGTEDAAESHLFQATATIDVNGQVWTLQMYSRPSREASAHAQREPLLLLLSGTLISLLLFGILWGMASTQRRALTLANTMTEALRRSEAKYSSLAQAALDAIVIADADGRIVSWNRGGKEIFGYSEAEVLGRRWTLVLPQRLRAVYRRALEQVAGQESPRLLGQVLELTGVRRSGEEFPMELSLAKWGSGEVFFSGIVRDVTERKRAEEALRLSEERFRVALKGADVLVFNQDRQLRYTWVYNPPLGLAEGDVLGRTDQDIFPGHPLIGIKQRVLDSGRPAHEKIEVQLDDGRTEYFDLVLEPVWERGVVVGLSGAALNITALTRTELELRASEARFRATFENAAIGIVLSDMNDQILEANPTFARMLGYEPGELRGHQITLDVHPDDLSDSRELFAGLRAGGRGYFKQQKRYLRKDGSTMWASLTLSLVRNDAGEPILAIRMIEDITELKSAQEALERAYRELEQRVEERTAALREQAQELARSNAELEQFAYVASHDLQEPLRSVSAFAQLLERRYGGQLGADGKQFIHFIVDGTARMRQLIVDLLAFSRVGAREKRFRPVEAEAVLRQTLNNLSGYISERGAEVGHDPLPVVWGEEVDLLQLFQNLIANGIKFNRTARPRVWVAAREQEDEWEFSVRDNGIGIDPHFIERIFTIFQRGVRSDEYPGTGVGLAICKKVVERHGGRIWFDSAPETGTTFFFTLKKPPV